MDAELRARLEAEQGALRQQVHRMTVHTPDIDRDRQRVDDVARRAQAHVERIEREAVQGVGGCVWRLSALDPFATLERGYAIVQRGSHVVSKVAEARAGEKLDVRVKDGAFGVHVAGGGPARRRRIARRVPEAQAPLFTMPERRA
jgi:exodeoxyribonuclease VII large subunit